MICRNSIAKTIAKKKIAKTAKNFLEA